MTSKHPLLNKNLVLLILCQGLFLTNNVTFIAINGLVGLSLSPAAWMATLPVMGYVVVGAFSTSIVAKTQNYFGRKTSFQLGLLVALFSALICVYAASTKILAWCVAPSLQATTALMASSIGFAATEADRRITKR